MLTALAPAGKDQTVELGTRGDVAFLRLAAGARPGRWAVVSTPGDRWFSLEVDGGFSLDYFEEDTSHEDVRAIMARYVDYALRYLAGTGVHSKCSLLGIPELELATESESVRLRRSLGAQIRTLARFGRGRD